MEKTLYVTDLDGTLLNKNDRINPKSIKIINDLVEKGMLFTYATARSLVSASVVTEGLSTNIPVIAYNGAFIFHPKSAEILSQEDFSQEEMNYAEKTIRTNGIYPLVYSFIDGVKKYPGFLVRRMKASDDILVCEKVTDDFVLLQIAKNYIKEKFFILLVSGRKANCSRFITFYPRTYDIAVQFSRSYIDQNISVRLCRLGQQRQTQSKN